MRNLAKQDLRLVRGRTAQSQLIAAGERPLAIALSGHTVLDLKARGAPIDQMILDPYFAQANKLMLARHAPILTPPRCLSIGHCPKRAKP